MPGTVASSGYGDFIAGYVYLAASTTSLCLMIAVDDERSRKAIRQSHMAQVNKEQREDD